MSDLLLFASADIFMIRCRKIFFFIYWTLPIWFSIFIFSVLCCCSCRAFLNKREKGIWTKGLNVCSIVQYCSHLIVELRVVWQSISDIVIFVNGKNFIKLCMTFFNFQLISQSHRFSFDSHWEYISRIVSCLLTVYICAISHMSWFVFDKIVKVIAVSVNNV